MTPAVLFAFASAIFLGAGVVTAQRGLKSVEPLSGAAISVPTFTVLFLLLSPLILRNEPVVWQRTADLYRDRAVLPGLADLADLCLQPRARAVVTSTLGNLAPLFAVTLAVVLLHEPLQAHQLVGAVIAVSGAVIITVTRPRDLGSWRSWGVAAAAYECAGTRRGAADRQARTRGLAEPVMGLPDRLHHVVAGGADGAVHPQGEVLPSRDRDPAGSGFMVTGISNGSARSACLPPSATVRSRWWRHWLQSIRSSTVGLSAILLKHIAITPRIVAGTLLTVAGVALVLIG